jgi:hypothetical protein
LHRSLQTREQSTVGYAHSPESEVQKEITADIVEEAMASMTGGGEGEGSDRPAPKRMSRAKLALAQASTHNEQAIATLDWILTESLKWGFPFLECSIQDEHQRTLQGDDANTYLLIRATCRTFLKASLARLERFTMSVKYNHADPEYWWRGIRYSEKSKPPRTHIDRKRMVATVRFRNRMVRVVTDRAAKEQLCMVRTTCTPTQLYNDATLRCKLWEEPGPTDVFTRKGSRECREWLEMARQQSREHHQE